MDPNKTEGHDEPGPDALGIRLEPWDTGDYLRRERFGPEQPENQGLASELGVPALDGSSAVPWEDIESSYQVIRIPGPLLSWEDKELWRRCVGRESLGLLPETQAELVIRQTRNGVIAANLGRRVSPEVVMAAVLVAIAKTERVEIKTPLRGLARHIGVQYSMFLKVRRIALRVIDQNRVVLGYAIE